LPSLVGRVLAVCQQLDEGRPWLPAGRRVAHGRQIEIKESHENITDDAPADWSESIAVTADIGLPQDVIPKRCFARPTRLYGTIGVDCESNIKSELP
jgi:hypothetical protein